MQKRFIASLLLAGLWMSPAVAEEPAATAPSSSPPSPVPLEFSATPGLTPYQAIYRVALVGNDPDSTITAAEGHYYADFSMTCAGNGSQARLLMTLTNREGSKASVTNSTTVWEPAGGLKMEFKAEMRNQRRLMREISGSASLDVPGGKGSAEVSLNGVSHHVVLPEGTVFPLAFSAHLLASALAGEPELKATVFDGQNGETGLSDMLLDIAPAQPLDEATALLVGSGAVKLWPVTTTRKPVGGEEADSQVSDGNFSILSNGVPQSMRFRYGDAVLEMKLERLEMQARPVCQRVPSPQAEPSR